MAARFRYFFVGNSARDNGATIPTIRTSSPSVRGDTANGSFISAPDDTPLRSHVRICYCQGRVRAQVRAQTSPVQQQLSCPVSFVLERDLTAQLPEAGL